MAHGKPPLLPVAETRNGAGMSKSMRMVLYFVLLFIAWALISFTPQTHLGENLNHVQNVMKALMYLGVGAIAAALAMDLARRPSDE